MDLKDLSKLIDLLRRKGITTYTTPDLSLVLSVNPPESNYKRRSEHDQPEDPLDPYMNFPTDNLTPEQLLYYSAGGLPENDPENV